MIRTQAQLTEEQDRQLEQIAGAARASKAELIRQAVDMLLRQRAVGRSTDEQWHRALAVIGAFRSGERDVAREHDAYLAEAYEAERE